MDGQKLDIVDNILLSVKKLLGIAPEYTHFDDDIIMNINSVFLEIRQLGVSLPKNFSVNSDSLWSEIIQDDTLLSAIRTFVYLKVRLLFDPPANSSAIESINKTLAGLEWRINAEVDYDSI